ncbi:MAG TPA: DedA family protein [Microlunatus sp.]|jgi:membrane protein DedA with SNARE-associated domain|nr:DedA family protein [Microlunatus sp.]
MIGWLQWLMETFGAPGAGLAVALESIFPPIPSEIVLPLAGFTASRGSLSLTAVLICTTIGSVVGAAALYLLGRRLGLDRLKRAADKMPLTDPEDIDRTDAWFNRHGSKAVFFGRMVPIFRSLISVPAGVNRMKMPTFIAFTLVGSLVWNTALVLAGYFLGEQWHRVESSVGVLQYVVLAVIVVAIGWFVVRRVRRRRAEASSSAE